MINPSFSVRENLRPNNVQIKVRNDAPLALRDAIRMLAYRLEMSPNEIRNVICEELLVAPNPRNWGGDFVKGEVTDLMYEAEWFKVYDIAEAVYAKLLSSNNSQAVQLANEFQRRLNDFFIGEGIGYELQNGQIKYRGSEVFENIVQEAPKALEEVGFQQAANEMREALNGISRRPKPNITGAIRHAMAALETTAREVTDEPKKTLGKLITELTTKLDLPGSLKVAIAKLWGYTSDRGRHVRENQEIDYSEAELVVTVAGGLCQFISQRLKGNSKSPDELPTEESLPF